jgi:hypothetical protein
VLVAVPVVAVLVVVPVVAVLVAVPVVAVLVAVPVVAVLVAVPVVAVLVAVPVVAVAVAVLDGGVPSILTPSSTAASCASEITTARWDEQPPGPATSSAGSTNSRVASRVSIGRDSQA